MRRLPPRARRGFIIFGYRGMRRRARGQAVEAVCPECRQIAMIEPMSQRTWFTLYFIPIFPVSRAQRLSRCATCKTHFRLDPEELARVTTTATARAGQAQYQRAIALYNTMRQSPSDPVALNELLDLYGQMNEYNEAISAAGAFPIALQASERCMTTFGRVLLANKDFPNAIRWFDAAIGRNSALPDAHYWRAVAFASLAPPDLQQASASARAARSLGAPEAEKLMRDIDSLARASA